MRFDKQSCKVNAGTVNGGLTMNSITIIKRYDKKNGSMKSKRIIDDRDEEHWK